MRNRLKICSIDFLSFFVALKKKMYPPFECDQRLHVHVQHALNAIAENVQTFHVAH